jgi:hypothetical protein
MIINHWAPAFRRLYGGEAAIPDDYFTFDIESSGFSRENDLIVEWGHAIVEGREVVDRNNIVLNWFARPDLVKADWLEFQLNRVARQMALNGRAWRLTPDFVRANGIDPYEALNWVHELLTTIQDSGTLLVSHGGWNFDCPMLCAHFAKDLDRDFTFNDNQMFDTSAIEKASQLVGHPRALPQPGETLKAYFKRIGGWRQSGIEHNLDQHCVNKYKLVEKYGVDVATLHTAGEDAMLLHYLMEEFRGLCLAPPSPAASAGFLADAREIHAECERRANYEPPPEPGVDAPPPPRRGPVRPSIPQTKTAAARAEAPRPARPAVQPAPPVRHRGQRSR